MYIIHNKKVI